jgi:hypothetical protein
MRVHVCGSITAQRSDAPSAVRVNIINIDCIQSARWLEAKNQY